MPDAFVETTVLTNILLKRDGSEKVAKQKLAQYDRSLVPEFAWKEFKRGPLSYARWLHNKLLDVPDLGTAVEAISRLARRQPYRLAGAMQAIQAATSRLPPMGALIADHGKNADPNVVMRDLIRHDVMRAIYRAWNGRRRRWGAPVQPLTCYPAQNIPAPAADKRINIAPTECPKGTDCCLRSTLTPQQAELAALRAALPLDQRTETARRRAVLRQLEKHPNAKMSPEDCRSFGDAYFVLFCPAGASIITTNRRDIDPLAQAIGRQVDTP